MTFDSNRTVTKTIPVFTHSNRNRLIQWRRRYIGIYEAKVWSYVERAVCREQIATM